MTSRKNDSAEIPEKLKHFGNAKVKKLGVGPGDYISIDGSDIPDHVEEIILDGSGSARVGISGWDGRLCILGELYVDVEGVSDVYLNINGYAFARVENCAQVKAVSNTTLEVWHCGNVELFDSTLAEVWCCDKVLAYNRSNVRGAKHSNVALFERATGKFDQGSVGVLMDSSYATAYSDAQIKSLSELASVVHESTVKVSGEGRFRCIGTKDDEASIFHATREALIRNATPTDLFQTEFLVYKTTDANGNTGELYDKRTHWEPGTTMTIPETDRDPKNPWLFFSPTLGHAVKRGEDYSDDFRVFLVRIHINDVKRQTFFHRTDLSEIEAWKGEVLTEVKHPTDKLFSVNLISHSW
jgi:hypothetical protein